MTTGSTVAPTIATNKRLEGKVAIITGGASGIGESSVYLFVENGAKVVIADVNDEAGQAISQKLGDNVSYAHCDVTKEEDIINLIDSTVLKYGHLDIMYNNAGIIDGGGLGGILDTSKEDLDRILSVNVVGSFLGAKHAARVMIPNMKGCILFTASAATAIGGISSHAYSVSKHGVSGLVKNLAGELGQYGIRVNCVSPFYVETNLSPIMKSDEMKVAVAAMMSDVANLKGKTLEADDVARAALFLASADAEYVSGLNLLVDGGFSVINPSIWKACGLIK